MTEFQLVGISEGEKKKIEAACNAIGACMDVKIDCYPLSVLNITWPDGRPEVGEVIKKVIGKWDQLNSLLNWKSISEKPLKKRRGRRCKQELGNPPPLALSAQKMEQKLDPLGS